MDSKVKASNKYFRWIIVLCSFINHMATVGVFLSLSVMYVHWLEEFQESKGVTAWALSLESSFTLAFCPVPAILASRFGFRAVAFVGGLMISLGIIASTFAESVAHLILFIGITTGIGNSFSYLPSIAMVALHFDKDRALAMGISTTGGGVGTFIFGPVLNYLIETYTWRGALLVLGGICLNLCATGLLFRPVNEIPMEKKEVEIALESKKMGEDIETLMEMETDIIVADNQIQPADPCINSYIRYNKNEGAFESSQSLNPVLLKYRLHVNEDQRMHASLNELHPKRVPATHSSFPNLNPPRKSKKSHESLVRSLRNMDMALLASANGFHLLNEETEADERHTFLPSNALKQATQETDKSEGNGSWATRFQVLSSLKTNLDMLRDKTFLLFCVSNFLTCLSYFTPVVYLVDRAVNQGIDIATGSVLISATGCGNILGRVITGLVAGSDCCSNRMLMYIVALCSQGIGTILSCLCGDFVVLHGIYAFYFGFHMGIYTVLSPLVTIDLKGRSNVATAYGVVLFFMGVASLIGPPISGWLFDWSRSYEWSYVTNGLFLVISGVLVIPLLWRRRLDQPLDET